MKCVESQGRIGEGMVRNEESTAWLAHRKRKEVLDQVIKDLDCQAKELVTPFGRSKKSLNALSRRVTW